MRAIVLLPADLAAVRLAGRPLADHWAFVAAQAALPIEPVPPDAALDEAPAIVVDGRHAAVAPDSLAALASRGQGALLSPAGDVVAAILDTPGGPLAERLAAAVGVEAVVAPAEGLRVDEDPGAVEAVVRRRWLATLAAGGARFVDPERTLVDTTALVGINAVIWPGTALLGQTKVGAGAEVQAGGWIEDTAVGAGAVVRPYTVCTSAEIGPGAHVGPFAHLRKGAVLEPEAKVGNFVEMKQARLGRGAKASHLTYLGDAEIGAHANIGAGTITCNYDGFGKYRTSIGEGAFVGSNTALVAPVSVGAGAIIGAGSVVTQDVPADALFVERAVPKLSEGRAPSLRERNRLRAESKKK